MGDFSESASLRSRLKKLVGPASAEVEEAVDELERSHESLESRLVDLAVGEGMPAGFNPESHLAPGLPRIRPMLVTLASRAAGDNGADPVDVVHAAELLHLAVAVHDTALGRQGGRRRRVARKLLGGAAHWLGGNHLMLRALEVARSAPHPEVFSELMLTLRELAEGHALAEDLRHRDATEADYRGYAEGHSGALFSFCTRAGGQLAGAERPVVGALGRYGLHLGVAWHGIEDQWLLALSPEEVSRNLAQRAATGRPTLPIIRALNTDPDVDRALDDVLSGECPGAADELLERVHASGGDLAVRRLVASEAMAAKRALSSVPEGPYRDIMHRIAGGLTQPQNLFAA